MKITPIKIVHLAVYTRNWVHAPSYTSVRDQGYMYLPWYVYKNRTLLLGLPRMCNAIVPIKSKIYPCVNVPGVAAAGTAVRARVAVIGAGVCTR